MSRLMKTVKLLVVSVAWAVTLFGGTLFGAVYNPGLWGGEKMFWAWPLPNGELRRVTVLEGAADVTNLLSKPQPRRTCTTAVPLDDDTSLAFDILSCLGGFAVIVH